MNLIRKITDSIRRKLGFYDSYGSRFSQRHLLKVGDDIAFYPLSAQARYADAVTVTNIKNENFILLSCASLLDGVPISESESAFTPTTIGNLAFIALNSHRKDIRTKCMDILDNYKAYVKSKRLIIKR